MSGSRLPDDAASALADIQRRQGQVIDAVLVPGWYWWIVAAAMVIIGAAVDYRHLVVLAVAIPAAILVLVLPTGGMIVGAYRHVRVRDSALLGGHGAVAIVGLVWLVVALTLAVAFGLRAAGLQAPATIGTVVGGAALVIAGPQLMRYLRRIMLAHRAGTGSAGTGSAGTGR